MTTTATLPTTETPTVQATAATPVLSILALISGISGIVFGLVIPLSIVAIVLGILAISREPRGRTMAIWGIVTGAVPGALAILGIVLATAIIVPLGAFAWMFGGF